MSDIALASYGDLFRVPGAWRFSVAGFFGRLIRSTSGIGAVLLVSGRTDTFAVAGLASGAIVVGAAAAGPLWSRTSDRLGQTRVLPFAIAAIALAGTLLIVSVDARWPIPVTVLAALLVGASSIDAGALSRARWMHLLDSERGRHKALALESVLDEFTFVVGPPIVTLLAAAITPEIGFTMGALASIGGCAALLIQRDTAPRPAAAGAASRPFRGWLPLGVLALLPGYVGIGLEFGSVDLSAIGIATGRGTTWLAGALLAVFAVGSVSGGLLFGALAGRWRTPLRLAFAGILFAVVMPFFAFAREPWSFAVVSLAAGFATTPVLISSSSLIETRVDRSTITLALSWPSVALSVGVTIGATLGGSAVDAGTPYGGLWLPMIAAALVLVTSQLNAWIRRP